MIAPHHTKKYICFFCDGPSSDVNKLSRIEKDTRIAQFKAAIRLSINGQWRVKLSTVVTLEDVEASDVSYHEECWLRDTHNILKSNPCKYSIFSLIIQ